MVPQMAIYVIRAQKPYPLRLGRALALRLRPFTAPWWHFHIATDHLPANGAKYP